MGLGKAVSGERRGPVISEFKDTSRARTCALLTGPSSAVVSRAWCDERRPISWTVTGLLAEPALAFATHKDYNAQGTENPCTDEPADSEAVPIIVERAIFIFRVIGIQSRQAC